jgi:hypothetical protein
LACDRWPFVTIAVQLTSIVDAIDQLCAVQLDR